MPFKTFKTYVAEQDMTGMPGEKSRNGLADPDPGELKNPHKPQPQDLDMAKQAIQIGMTHNPKWELKVYNFLKKMGTRIPEVGNLVDQMTKPKGFDRLTAPQLGKSDLQPDVMSPNSADSSPAFYQQ
jgi:hypothetical protein